MKLKVTKQRLIIPKDFLDGIEEVEISREGSVVLVKSIDEIDPIFELGKNPVGCGVADASEDRDKYLHNFI